MAKITARGAHEVCRVRTVVREEHLAGDRLETSYTEYLLRSDGKVLGRSSFKMHRPDGTVDCDTTGWTIRGSIKTAVTEAGLRSALDRRGVRLGAMKVGELRDALQGVPDEYDVFLRLPGDPSVGIPETTCDTTDVYPEVDYIDDTSVLIIEGVV